MAARKLVGSLEAVLALLRQHADRAPPAAELNSAAKQFILLGSQHGPHLGDADAETRRVLTRGVCELGPLLARLDSQFQRAGSTEHQLIRVATLASSAATLGVDLRLSVSEWQQLSASAALLLGSGTAALEQAVAMGGSALALLTAQVLTAHNQAVGATDALRACGADHTQLAHALPGFAAAKAARWLGALAAALSHEAPQMHVSGDTRLLDPLCTLACTFLASYGHGPELTSAFQVVQAAVGSNPAVQQQLARAVWHCVHISSTRVLQHVASAGPAEPGVLEAWAICADAMQLACSPPLLPVMRRQLQEAQAHAAVWLLAFRLAEQLPAQPPASVPARLHAELWGHLLRLVGEVVMTEHAADAEQGLHASLRNRLVSLFPRAAAAVKALSGMSVGGIVQGGLFLGAAALAFSVGRAAPSNGDQLGALLAAADAALRLLPLVVQHAATGTGGGSSHGSAAEEPSLQHKVAGTAKHLLPYLTDQIAFNIGAGCAFLDGPFQCQPDAAAIAQLLPHAVQLHGSACRLVHWTAQLPAAEQRLVLEGVRDWRGLLNILSDAHKLIDECNSAAADEDEPSLQCLQLGAHAAHVEACLVVRNGAGWGSGCSATSASAAAAFAARLLSDLQDPLTVIMDAQLLAELMTTVMPLHGTASSEQATLLLLAAAARSPVVCSMLLQDGTLQRLLSTHAVIRSGQAQALNTTLFLPTWAQQAACAAASDQLAQQLRSAAQAFESDIQSYIRTVGPRVALSAAQPGSAHPAIELAQLLLQHYQSPEQQAAARLELARAAATRPCAYLRCANLGAEAGPDPSRQSGSQRCGGCKAVRYCGTTCSHADWRGPLGHRRLCAALAAERAAALAAGNAGGT